MNLRNQKSHKFSFPKEVLSALSAGAPVVALESTIISHGLPRPENLRVAIEVEETVGSRDAVPATITIVCSAVKSILDVSATLERLETLNVEVVVYTSHQFPGLFLSDSGITVDWSLSDSTEIADVVTARRSLSIRSGLVIAHPLPAANQLDPDLHDQVLAEGLKFADSKKITGKEVTPFLLDHFHRATHGQSLVVNPEIIVRNAELAARIAVADSGTATGSYLSVVKP